MLALGTVLRTTATARAVLGLNEGQTYTPSDIKKAFREKALTAHPDTGGDAEHFCQIQGAYEELLREQSSHKSSTATSSSAKTDGDGFGFCSHPHAQWTNDRRTYREYWRQTYEEEELNMNTNERGSREHPSNTHYRARSHRNVYGEGLGEEFARASATQRGRHANFSTYYFYRPYETDYCNPYTTGFTEEEIQQAAREQRHAMLRRVALHTCLWLGLFLVAYLHERNNRVRRATEARDKGYRDPAYWQQLREEEAEAKKHNRAPLRLENHWLEMPLFPPMPMNAAEEKNNNNEEATGDAAAKLKKTQERRQHAVRRMGAAFRVGGGTQVVSFQGRAFTPNGVRGARNSPPMGAKTCTNDLTYDASDLDGEDEALD